MHRNMSSHPGQETRLRQLGARNFTPWRWVLVADSDGAMRGLVQDGAPPTNIYAIGSVLSSQARLIADLGPPVLADLENAQALALDATEGLEFATLVLERHLQRAYHLKHYEHYSDLRLLVKNVAAVLSALQQSALVSNRLLDSLELAEARNRRGNPQDRVS